jgi:hypothetical protein
MILPAQDSNTTFHCKLIFFWAGGCSIQRFANCTLGKPKLAPEGAQRFDARTKLDSWHFARGLQHLVLLGLSVSNMNLSPFWFKIFVC